MAKDPYKAFRFRLEINGLIVAMVSEVTGLQLEVETETYEEGGINHFVHIFPKQTKYQNIVLKRGITDYDDLWTWCQDVVSGKFEKKDGAIILINENKEDALRWNFVQAYPVKWTGPEFRADNSTVAFESIEMAHEGIEKG